MQAHNPTILHSCRRTTTCVNLFWQTFTEYCIHTYVMAFWVQLLAHRGIHYCSAQRKQGQSLKEICIFPKVTPFRCPSAQDWWFSRQLLIRDIFSSVGGWKSFQHNNVVLKADHQLMFFFLVLLSVTCRWKMQEKTRRDVKCMNRICSTSKDGGATWPLKPKETFGDVLFNLKIMQWLKLVLYNHQIPSSNTINHSFHPFSQPSYISFRDVGLLEPFPAMKAGTPCTDC